MLTIARARLQKDEEDGFTLIELMVVVLIIAILLAIAIPTFLGAQDRARDRGAQSDLRNAVTAAKTIATDDAGELDGVTKAELDVAEAALEYKISGAVDTDTILLNGGGAAAVAAVGTTPAVPGEPDYMQFTTASESGTVFSMAISAAGTVGFCSWDAATGTALTVDDAALTNCNFADFQNTPKP